MLSKYIKAVCIMCLMLNLAACGARSADIPVEEKIEGSWLVASIGGTPVQIFALQEAPALFFDVGTLKQGKLTGRLGGSDGCNRLMGHYTFAQEETLTFGPIGSTRRACMEGGEQATRMAQALDAVRTWRWDGQNMVLQDSNKQPLMVLKR